MAFLLQAMTYVCVGSVWRAALAALGRREPLGRLLRLAILKVFADQSVPSSGLSGTLVVTRALARRGVPWPDALGAMLFAGITKYGAYLAATIAAISLLWLFHDASPLWVGLAGAAGAVAIAIPVLLLLAKRWVHHATVSRLARWFGAEDALDALADAPTDLIRRPVLLLGGVVGQGLVFLFDSLPIMVMFLALGEHVGLQATFPALVMATVAVTVAPLPTSLGTFEAACVAVLVSLGARSEAALAATLLFRGLAFWLPILPGSYLMRAELATGGSGAGVALAGGPRRRSTSGA